MVWRYILQKKSPNIGSQEDKAPTEQHIQEDIEIENSAAHTSSNTYSPSNSPPITNPVFTTPAPPLRCILTSTHPPLPLVFFLSSLPRSSSGDGRLLLTAVTDEGGVVDNERGVDVFLSRPPTPAVAALAGSTRNRFCNEPISNSSDDRFRCRGVAVLAVATGSEPTASGLWVGKGVTEDTSRTPETTTAPIRARFGGVPTLGTPAPSSV